MECDGESVKRILEDLAGFGGAPAFEHPLRVGAPNIGDRERFSARLDAAFARGWLSNDGPLAKEFERRVAQTAGTRYAVATCNATAALQLAIRAADLTGEIIVPSLTFAATAHVVSWLGLTPVFCDVDPLTGQIDPDHARTLIGPRTSAILAVHLWGRTAPAERLETIARRHGLALFFDASHAFACTRGGRPVGGFGDAEIFSFHSTKFVNAFEGGALVTNDESLARRVQSIRNFGITAEDEVSHVGINAKMNEASAAMGLTSLDSIDRFVARNLDNHRRYRAGLAGVPGIRLIPFDEGERHNYQYVVIEVDPRRAGISRDTLRHLLHQENVLARRYFHPGCHRMAPYTDRPPLPATEHLSERVLALPTGMSVTRAQVAKICEIIRVVVVNSQAIAERVPMEVGAR
ncbi:aminotransferase class I/II-fold pyridoxal phosphate-dependent enzyme [Streptosporangium sandarakinum]